MLRQRSNVLIAIKFIVGMLVFLLLSKVLFCRKRIQEVPHEE